jgi:hypothetical protein
MMNAAILSFQAEIRDAWTMLAKEEPDVAGLLLPRRFADTSAYHSPETVAAAIAVTAIGPLADLEGPSCTPLDLQYGAYLTVSNLLRLEMPTYFVAPKLLDAVSQTDIPSSLTLQDFHWPLDAMLLVLPKGHYRLPNGREPLFLAYSHNESAAERLTPPPMPAISISGSNASFFSVMTSGSTVTHVLSLNGLYDSVAAWGNSPTQHLEMSPDFSDAQISDPDRSANSLQLLTVKLLLAISARPSLVATGQLIRQAKVKHGRTKSGLWTPNIIGRGYLPRTESEDPAAPGSPKRLHWVRGHYRRQPSGPRETPRYETIWIEPFLSGTT